MLTIALLALLLPLSFITLIFSHNIKQTRPTIFNIGLLLIILICMSFFAGRYNYENITQEDRLPSAHIYMLSGNSFDTIVLASLEKGVLIKGVKSEPISLIGWSGIMKIDMK